MSDFHDTLRARGPVENSLGAFHMLKWAAVDNVELWSPNDEARAFDEGWCIGRRSWLARDQMKLGLAGVWQSGPYSIGSRGRTFINDEDAQTWVEQQAQRLNN